PHSRQTLTGRLLKEGMSAPRAEQESDSKRASKDGKRKDHSHRGPASPARGFASTGFVPEAITRTSTSPGPRAGVGTSRRSNSSASPKRGITIARIRPSFPHAPSSIRQY